MMAEQFGPYRVGARLGRGGMGEVHEAFDTVRERTVALKRLLADDQDDPDVRERFRRESRIAARLDSPHVVPIHDFGVIDGRMFIDMRLVRGRDLGSLLAAEGPLPAERAVGIAAAARAVLERLSSSTEARTYDVHTVPSRPEPARAAPQRIGGPGARRRVRFRQRPGWRYRVLAGRWSCRCATGCGRACRLRRRAPLTGRSP